MKVVRQETSENMENMFHCSGKVIYYSENTENENRQIISPIFLTISVISVHNK